MRACDRMVPRMVIVFNPVAGRRRAALLWRVLDVLAANGIRLDLAETHRAGHAEALAREAVRGGAPMVVAAGGDGTIAEVANGLMGSRARLGVIPLGTANVLAHELASAVRAAGGGGGAGVRAHAARCGPAWRAGRRARGCSCRCWEWASTRRWCTGCRSR